MFGKATMVFVVCLALGPLLAAWAAPASGPAASLPAGLDEAIRQLPAYRHGQGGQALSTIANALRDSAGKPQRKELVDRLAKLLATDATPDAKEIICGHLTMAGTPDTVPLIAPLLVDERLSHMARHAMERIPGPAATAALRDAMGQVKGKVLAGVVNSLGERRDAQATAAIAKLLGDADPLVGEAAAAALGKIGTPEAMTALTSARPSAVPPLSRAIADALLLYADRLLSAGKRDEAAAIYQQMDDARESRHVRAVAFKGMIAAKGDKAMATILEAMSAPDADRRSVAIASIRDVAGAEAIKSFVDVLPKLSPAEQAIVLEELSERGHAAVVRPAAMASALSMDHALRLAALAALGKVGDASALPLLLETAGGDDAPAAQRARASLASLAAKDADTALLNMLGKAEAKAKVEVIKALVARNSSGAATLLLEAAGGADAAVALQAIAALGALAQQKDLPDLLVLLTKSKTDAVRTAVEDAICSVARRAGDADQSSAPLLAAIEKAPAPLKCSLVRALGRIASPTALPAIRAALKDPDAGVRDAAIRALVDWPTAAVAADLLELAGSAGEQVHQVLALRGYVRVVGLPSQRPAAETLKHYLAALAVAKRPEEQRIVLAGMAALASADALKATAPLLDKPATAEEAALAAVSIAGRIKPITDEVKAVMGKVLEVSKNRSTREKAQKVIGGK